MPTNIWGSTVIPAEAGIQCFARTMLGPRFRGDDDGFSGNFNK